MVTLAGEVVAAGVRAGKFVRYYDTVAAMLADTIALSTGEVIEAAGHRYTAAASDATDHHLTRGDGAKLYVEPTTDGYNVKAFGAVGDAVTDDLAAIHLAVAAARTGVGSVYFPAGTYEVSDTIQVMPSGGSTDYPIIFRGSNSDDCIIEGTVDNGPIIDFVGPVAGNQGSRGAEYLTIINYSATGGWCVWVQNLLSTTIFRSCQFRPRFGSSGVRQADPASENANTFGVLYEGCLFKTARQDPGTTIGLAMTGHTSVICCDFTSFEKGIVASRSQNYVSGCRIESCRYGIIMGEKSDGSKFKASRSALVSNSFEANNFALYVRDMGGMISGSGIRGSNSAKGANGTADTANSQVGIEVNTAVSFSEISFEGLFDEAAVRVNVDGCIFSGVGPVNDLSDRPKWDFKSPITNTIFENCARLPVGTTTPTTLTRSLQQFNFLNFDEDLPRSRNLCKVAVPVTEAATSVAVAFPPDVAIADSEIGASNITATTGGSLAAGTYYYMATSVNEMGESGRLPIAKERSVVVDGSNNAVTINLTIPSTRRVRVYRGTTSDVYDGYYEITSAPFLDTGATFDGIAQPPATGVNIPSAQEPNANYGVIVTPSWGTTAWVTDKATSGFTINFGTAAPAGATVDWILMR